jgi:hypothetical protein
MLEGVVVIDNQIRGFASAIYDIFASGAAGERRRNGPTNYSRETYSRKKRSEDNESHSSVYVYSHVPVACRVSPSLTLFL